MIDSFTGQYRFLSNFYYSPITVLGLRYPTVEHAFQAMKCDDIKERKKIRDAQSPGKAKRLGRKVKLIHNWESIKRETMLLCVRLKFKSDPLRQKLLDTGDQELIEGNYWNDTYWGVCNGKGSNHLGKILMQVRDELRQPSLNL